MKILLIDDHALFGDGLALLLKKQYPDCRLTQALSCEEGLALAARTKALDLVLLDLQLPDLHGFDGLKRLKASRPALPVVLVSAWASPEVVQEGLNYGASAFLSKAAPAKGMLQALKKFLKPSKKAPRAGPPAAGSRLKPVLTARQREVLAQVVLGKANKEIAGTLGLTLNTVRAHMATILKALGARSRTEASLKAVKLGLVRNA
jgi:DNA-binding NarL/FixJ family response regulator